MISCDAMAPDGRVLHFDDTLTPGQVVHDRTDPNAHYVVGPDLGDDLPRLLPMDRDHYMMWWTAQSHGPAGGGTMSGTTLSFMASSYVAGYEGTYAPYKARYRIVVDGQIVMAVGGEPLTRLLVTASRETADALLATVREQIPVAEVYEMPEPPDLMKALQESLDAAREDRPDTNTGDTA